MNATEEFINAVLGGKGELDAWLECNNEEEVKAAILAALAIEREACAKVCEAKHANGNFKYDTRDDCAAAIRSKGTNSIADRTHA